MLAIPFLGTGMERHVARRGVGIFAELADAGVGILPEDLFLAGGERVANFVGVVVRQRRAGIERPAAVVDAGVVFGKTFKAAGFDRVFAPAQPSTKYLKA